MKQTTQNGTYITIRIHKHNNTKCIIYKIKQDVMLIHNLTVQHYSDVSPGVSLDDA